jgi:phage-related protein
MWLLDIFHIKSLRCELREIKELIMGAKDAVQANAVTLGEIAGQIRDGVANLANDIANLSGPLAGAMTEAEVNAILGPKLDEMKALADNITALAAVTPEAVPPVEPPPL